VLDRSHQGAAETTAQAFPESVERVARALKLAGHPHAPVMLASACRTSAEAAAALNVEVAQIAKSVIFRRKADDMAIMVIAAGDKRVDEKKVAAQLGIATSAIGKADAEFVRRKTGFVIGGVSPVVAAHASAPVVLVDESLARFDVVWAAAGHPHAVFQLTLSDIERLTYCMRSALTI
jgi:prolyl-tRNA editing enzyme YbaK/EbsC (Cys-tRNA(Pro) deacylase)